MIIGSSWRNTDDKDVGKFLRRFDHVPLDEIARLEALEGSEINAAKEVLANEATKLSGPRKRRPARRRNRACHLRGRISRRRPAHHHVVGDDIALV